MSTAITVGMTGNTSYYRVGPDDAPYREGITTDITILNLTGTYKWLRDRRLSTTAGVGYIGSSNGSSEPGRKVDNTKTSLRLEVEYKLNEMTVLGANLRYISYTDRAVSAGGYDNGYTEPIFGVTVRSNF
jgi:hypothetical protein